MGFTVLMGICLLAVSCMQALSHREKPIPVKVEPESVSKLRHALDLLEKGERTQSQEILAALLQEGPTPEVRSSAYFHLGVIKLYEMDDLDSVEECKDYFDAYAEKFANGTFQKNSQDISQLLGKYIQQSHKQQQRIKALSHQVKEETQEIETLQYKILKMEEIQQETDKKRKSLDQTN